jgi:hypothetical protein
MVVALQPEHRRALLVADADGMRQGKGRRREKLRIVLGIGQEQRRLDALGDVVDRGAVGVFRSVRAVIGDVVGRLVGASAIRVDQRGGFAEAQRYNVKVL